MTVSGFLSPAVEDTSGDVMGGAPLIEMTLAVQFATVSGLRTPHIGLLWGKFRERFPRCGEAPPVQPAFEMFGGPVSFGGPQFSMQLGPIVPRIVFENHASSILLHIQQDRLMLTWRRYPADVGYPGFGAMRSQLASELSLFEEFVHSEGLGEIRPNQCEATYINAIRLPGDNAVHEHLDHVTPLWRQADVGLPFDAAMLQSRYVIRNGEESIGRLYTTFTPAFLTATSEPNYQLEIVARARPEHETVAAAFELLDRAHEMVGVAFDKVTTPRIGASREG